MTGLPLFDRPYPSTPGFKRPGTSQDAAAAMQPKASLLRERCLAVLREGPRTADEVAGVLRMDRLAIRPRLSELVEMKLIEPTGERRKNASGQSANVWRVKD